MERVWAFPSAQVKYRVRDRRSIRSLHLNEVWKLFFEKPHENWKIRINVVAVFRRRTGARMGFPERIDPELRETDLDSAKSSSWSRL